MIGSNPTHFKPAFSHAVHAGKFWSHRFFRSLHLLQADTLRKEELALALALALELKGPEADVAGNEVLLEKWPWESKGSSADSRVLLVPEFMIARKEGHSRSEDGKGIMVRACLRVIKSTILVMMEVKLQVTSQGPIV